LAPPVGGTNFLRQVNFTLAKNTMQAEIGFLKKKSEDKS
jgi:hypothetical protein